MLYEFIITKRMNIRLDKAIPIFQANFFCGAPTYSGICLLTIKRPIISEGENLGLTKTKLNTVQAKFVKGQKNRIFRRHPGCKFLLLLHLLHTLFLQSFYLMIILVKNHMTCLAFLPLRNLNKKYTKG